MSLAQSWLPPFAKKSPLTSPSTSSHEYHDSPHLELINSPTSAPTRPPQPLQLQPSYLATLQRRASDLQHLLQSLLDEQSSHLTAHDPTTNQNATSPSSPSSSFLARSTTTTSAGKVIPVRQSATRPRPSLQDVRTSLSDCMTELATLRQEEVSLHSRALKAAREHSTAIASFRQRRAALHDSIASVHQAPASQELARLRKEDAELEQKIARLELQLADARAKQRGVKSQAGALENAIEAELSSYWAAEEMLEDEVDDFLGAHARHGELRGSGWEAGRGEYDGDKSMGASMGATQVLAKWMTTSSTSSPSRSRQRERESARRQRHLRDHKSSVSLQSYSDEATANHHASANANATQDAEENEDHELLEALATTQRQASHAQRAQEAAALEHAALIEGVEIWRGVVKELGLFQHDLSSFLMRRRKDRLQVNENGGAYRRGEQDRDQHRRGQASQSQSQHSAGPGSATDDTPPSTPPILTQMSALISALASTLEDAESKGWNLLVCAIGAELQALIEGREVLCKILGFRMPEGGGAVAAVSGSLDMDELVGIGKQAHDQHHDDNLNQENAQRRRSSIRPATTASSAAVSSGKRHNATQEPLDSQEQSQDPAPADEKDTEEDSPIFRSTLQIRAQSPQGQAQAPSQAQSPVLRQYVPRQRQKPYLSETETETEDEGADDPDPDMLLSAGE